LIANYFFFFATFFAGFFAAFFFAAMLQAPCESGLRSRACCPVHVFIIQNEVFKIKQKYSRLRLKS